MIDSHCHLNSDPLFADRRSLCDRAEAAGVGAFVVIGFDLASSERAVEIAESDSRCFAVVGIHPHDAEKWDDRCALRLRQWAENPRVVAIGEIGMDFYTGRNNERRLASPEVQARAFRDQLELAASRCLPVVIHCREAYEETLNLLEQEAPPIPILLHCFAGTAEQAERAFARGWYIGVGGTVTYKANGELRSIVRQAPGDRLLLETDAPYLSPEPFRGKFPNVPERIPLIADHIARVRDTRIEEIAATTDANVRRVFSRMP
ncbi:MAG: TatD family hydrolase [Bacteroidia bacterium]|nr:TatD family hydrolase [Bacteroidia bacterium]